MDPHNSPTPSSSSHRSSGWFGWGKKTGSVQSTSPPKSLHAPINLSMTPSRSTSRPPSIMNARPGSIAGSIAPSMRDMEETQDNLEYNKQLVDEMSHHLLAKDKKIAGLVGQIAELEEKVVDLVAQVATEKEAHAACKEGRSENEIYLAGRISKHEAEVKCQQFAINELKQKLASTELEIATKTSVIQELEGKTDKAQKQLAAERSINYNQTDKFSKAYKITSSVQEQFGVIYNEIVRLQKENADLAELNETQKDLLLGTLCHAKKRSKEDKKESEARLKAKDKQFFQLQRILRDAEKAATKKEIADQNRAIRVAWKLHEAAQVASNNQIAALRRKLEEAQTATAEILKEKENELKSLRIENQYQKLSIESDPSAAVFSSATSVYLGYTMLEQRLNTIVKNGQRGENQVLRSSAPDFFPAYLINATTAKFAPAPVMMRQPQFLPVPVLAKPLAFSTATMVHKKANVAPKAKKAHKAKAVTQEHTPHVCPQGVDSELVVTPLVKEVINEVEETEKANKEIESHGNWNRSRMHPQGFFSRRVRPYTVHHPGREEVIVTPGAPRRKRPGQPVVVNEAFNETPETPKDLTIHLSYSYVAPKKDPEADLLEQQLKETENHGVWSRSGTDPNGLFRRWVRPYTLHFPGREGTTVTLDASYRKPKIQE